MPSTIGVQMTTVFRRRFDPLKRRPRARMFSWSRKRHVEVRWGCFVLTLRYVPFRGWRAVALVRLSPDRVLLWPSSSEEVVP